MPRRIEIKIELSEKEAAKVMYEMLWNEKTAIVKRAKILHYANIGTKSLTELCNLSDCKQVAVKNVLRLFENNGIEVMYDVSRGKKKSRLDDFEQEIEEYFDKNPPRSICEAIKMIKEKFGITITETPLRNWLKKNEFAYRKSKSIPVKANVETQKFFLNNVLLPLLQRAVENQCKVFFCDGVHLIYGYIGGYRWCKKRVCVPSAYGRKRANLLGFLDPISLKTEQIMNDTYLNSDSVCEGLKLLRKKYPFSPIFIVLDNAAYQRCKKVKDFAAELSISLVFLPPYSPNLNLIERLWKFLRNNLLSDKYFHTFSEFYNSISDFIDYVHVQHFSALRSLISFNFESFEDIYILDLL